jgi:hypothetical protein
MTNSTTGVARLIQSIMTRGPSADAAEELVEIIHRT